MITRGSGSAVRIGATVRAVRTWVVVLGMGCAVSVSGWAAGQQAGAEPSTDVESQHAGPAPATEVDAFDLHDPRTPAGALRSYIDACRGTDFTAAAQRLNLVGVDPAERTARGPQLARRLKTVLDQKLWINYERLSRDPQGRLDDGLPSNLEMVGTIPADPEVDILLELLPGVDGAAVWSFSASTVEQIPRLYELYGYGRLGELLPASFFEFRFLEINLTQWIALILLVVAAYLLSWLLVQLVHRMVRPLVARTRTEIDDRLLGMLAGPLRLLFAVALFAGGALPLRFAEPVVPFLGAVVKALVVLAVTWIALRLTDVVSAVIEERLKKSDRASAIAALPLGRRSVKTVLIALAVIGVLQNLGVNVTGLIAGLGVGGLAVALAAQKTLANLFGGVSLIVDQPVRVGDFCRFGDGKLGVIETIGLRSTRVRTLDRTLITVPNSEFSEIHLENFAARDRIRLVTVLGLRYETTADQLRFVLAELRKSLLEHPRVLDDPARVRFVGFGAHSLDLEVYAYVGTNDWSEFLKIREDLFLRFMDVVGAAGTGFAFPSQTLYLGRDEGLDRELSTRAEQAVQGWREAGELPFPDFSSETVAKLRDSGDYPPTGSVTR